MKQFLNRKMNVKKFIQKNKMPILVFLTGIGILTGVIGKTRADNRQRVRMMAQLNAYSYAERMISDLREGASVTNALEEIVVSENGAVDRFSTIAADMMNDSIQSIQIAPGGVVTEIYPEKGNEAGKIDLIHDKKRGEITRYGRDHNMTIMQGPFPLKQDGSGIAVRNPVYIQDAQGQETFWGFTIVIIRVPEIFSNSLHALANFGYDYRLSKTSSPLNDGYEEVYSCGGDFTDAVDYTFDLGGCSWKLEVKPVAGWDTGNHTIFVAIFGFLIVILLTGLLTALLQMDERRREFKKLSVTDPLTGLLNRNGFGEQLQIYLKEYPDQPCVGVTLDIDDFKFINDIYGHASGDEALQKLAETMKRIFGDNAILGRNGGDEFCMILKNISAEKAREQLDCFLSDPGTFHYKKETYSIGISMGYAEYPKQAETQEDLLNYADVALYEVKLHGKHGCLSYRGEFQPKKRTSLGFALQDVSENLPAAFLIYRADPSDDCILYANREMIRYAGCRDLDEFLQYTGHRFRNLIAVEEQERVEQSIWDQIHASVDTVDDFVHFHFVKKDGSKQEVLDHGRIVENACYGKVFYVFIMDYQQIFQRYLLKK